MKKIFLLLLIISVFFMFQSCTKEDDEKDTVAFIDQFMGTYKGGMETVNFYDDQYLVTVTKISNTRIKINPQGANEMTFEVEMKKNGDNSLVQAVESSGHFVALNKTDNEITLSYWIENNNAEREYYDGVKQ